MDYNYTGIKDLDNIINEYIYDKCKNCNSLKKNIISGFCIKCLLSDDNIGLKYK